MSTAKGKTWNLGMIGAGRMGSALLSGVLSSGLLPAKRLIVSDLDRNKLKALKKSYGLGVAGANRQVVEKSQVVVLAVKPQAMPAVLKEIRPLARKGQLFISIAAGITLGTLRKALSPASCIRVMPNNPCLVGAGVSALSFGPGVSRTQVALAQKIFAAAGEVVVVEEKFMDLVTALSGSGPAFIYNVIEALLEAAEQFSLPEKTAFKLVLQTVLGAVVTLKKTGHTPQKLREMVTSPGGTTIEGLRVLERREFKLALKEAVTAAARRSAELSRQFSL